LNENGTCGSLYLQQPNKKAKDLGKTEKGEDWNHVFDHLQINHVEDWYAADDLSVNAWYQTITFGDRDLNP